MAKKATLRCRKIKKISDDLTDRALKLYDKGSMVEFWDAINALDLLQDVEIGICERDGRIPGRSRGQ